MRIALLILSLAVQLTIGTQALSRPATTSQLELARALQDVLAVGGPGVPELVIRDQDRLAALYAGRAYEPLWIAPTGLTVLGDAMVTALLRIDEAAPEAIRPLILALRPRHAIDADTDIELILSAALMRAAVDPHDPTSIGNHPEALAAMADAADLQSALRAWLPPDPEFWRLREAILRYRSFEKAGGWSRIPTGPKLEAEMRDGRVALLRDRLTLEGDLAGESLEPDLFDGPLRDAVQRFQERHGLATDGVVGRATIEALNLPVQDRLKSLLLNLKRVHDRPWATETRYLLVNVAGANYRLVDEGKVVFAPVVIVGRRDWPTPMLDSAIDRLEINPFWYVPPRITKLELLPRLERDPGYLSRNQFRLVNGIYRQDPGPKNPLGVVKFLFPNRYSVYLHDTNNPELFERSDRFLSHGCVRLSNARELAVYLLAEIPGWSGRLDRAIASGRTQSVLLSRPLPIHIVYETAWVDPSGRVNFRKDIYGRDR